MCKELILKGLTEVEGMKFHDIEGGFGENKKSMLVRDIAKIHGKELKHINEAINVNRKRFKNGIDIIDLKSTKFEVDLLDHKIYNQNSINRSNNIYLLSERGYSKLLKILEDDFAWEQYEKLVDGYFYMRKENMNPYKGLSKELKAIFVLDEKHQKLENEVKDLKDNMPLFNIECDELQSQVRKIGVRCLGGKNSRAYKDRSLRAKVYCDIQRELKRQFGVQKYKAIKRSQLEIAKDILNNYKLPLLLEDNINLLNNQIKMGDD